VAHLFCLPWDFFSLEDVIGRGMTGTRSGTKRKKNVSPSNVNAKRKKNVSPSNVKAKRKKNVSPSNVKANVTPRVGSNYQAILPVRETPSRSNSRPNILVFALGENVRTNQQKQNNAKVQWIANFRNKQFAAQHNFYK
jgi:hypothetical protein